MSDGGRKRNVMRSVGRKPRRERGSQLVLYYFREPSLPLNQLPRASPAPRPHPATRPTPPGPPGRPAPIRPLSTPLIDQARSRPSKPLSTPVQRRSLLRSLFLRSCRVGCARARFPRVLWGGEGAMGVVARVAAVRGWEGWAGELSAPVPAEPGERRLARSHRRRGCAGHPQAGRGGGLSSACH